MNALRDALLASTQTPRALSDADAARLRLRVDAAVDSLRSTGAPDASIIVSIKRLACEVGITPDNGRLHDRIIIWTLERCQRRAAAPSAQSA